MAKETARMIIQSCITLSSAALGLVAALAWNAAINALMKGIRGGNEALAALFTYAVPATLLAVVVVSMLAKMAAKIGGEAAVAREAEG